MNNREHILTCLAEECAEVAQRVSKSLRFGHMEVQPGQTLTNSERLSRELDDDLFGVHKMLVDLGELREPDHVAIDDKIRKVVKYMDYARGQGTLK